MWGCLEPSNQSQKSNLDLLTDSLSLSCHYLNADIIADMINPTIRSSPRSPTSRTWRAVLYHSWKLREQARAQPNLSCSIAARASSLAALPGAASTGGQQGAMAGKDSGKGRRTGKGWRGQVAGMGSGDRKGCWDIWRVKTAKMDR